MPFENRRSWGVCCRFPLHHQRERLATQWIHPVIKNIWNRYCIQRSLFLFDNMKQQEAIKMNKSIYILVLEQRAWRKRQLCYRLSERSSVFLAITDIIILSKAKKAPEGFTMAGEVNGLLICYKSAPLPSAADPKPLPSLTLPPLQVNLQPLTPSPEPQSLNGSRNSKPNSPSGPAPVRPAPLPPTNNRLSADSTGSRPIVVASATMSGHFGKSTWICVDLWIIQPLFIPPGLEGVPFTLGPRVQSLGNSAKMNGLRGRFKTAQEINNEYQYSFTTERGAMFRL